MCAYQGDNPADFQLALESILNQSTQADEIILVVDGPVGAPLHHIIKQYQDTENERLTAIFLPENAGLTRALNHGLKHCNHPLVVRMDADDIAHRDRIKHQLGFMQAHPEVALLGTQMTEFTGSPKNLLPSKTLPLCHGEIVRKLPWRNPINHPTVCFRRDIVVKLGGYPELKFLEDYFLWSKLIARGYRCQNLPLSLLFYRFDDQTLLRRSGAKNFTNEIRLRWWLRNHDLCSTPTFLVASLMQLILRFAPISLRRYLWRRARSTALSGSNEQP